MISTWTRRSNCWPSSRVSPICSGEQAQGIGNRLHLVEVFGLMTNDATRVDCALEGVDRFAPVEHAQQLAAKDVVEEIIAQEHGAQ